jgi:KAP family P-loop domain
VLDLVADNRRPVVVFVDDLDRCTQSSVVQVIEAINLFLAGQFPNCVFVLAMEPDVVAAHIEVAYEKVLTVLKADQATEWSALGWRFLEKMVQLPLSIPAPTPEQVDAYLTAVLGGGAPRTPPLDSERVRRLEAAIRRQGGDLGGIRGAARAAEREVAEAAASDEVESAALSAEAIAAAEQAFAESFRDDAPGVKDIVGRHVQWLSANPREIKRFVNLFRFYAFIQVRRELRGLPAPTLDQVAKLAVLAIRWPQLVSRLVGVAADGKTSLLARLELLMRMPPGSDGPPGWAERLEDEGLHEWADLVAAEDLGRLLAAEPHLGDAPPGLL